MNQYSSDVCNLESRMRKIAAMELKNQQQQKQCASVDNSRDLIHLGGENFVHVNNFLGQTRVHIRKYVKDEVGEFVPTKDGVSLSPVVWRSLCFEMKTNLNNGSSEKTFIIEKDLCVSKLMQSDVQIFVLQRLFQRKNLTMEFVPERVILRGPEMGKLIDNMDSITDVVKDNLITYTLSHYISKVLCNSEFRLNPDYHPDHFMQLLESLNNCLAVAITIKIAELTKCLGCRENHQMDFMHDCKILSADQKWSKYFDLALYMIDMEDVAKDIVEKNFCINFDFVLGQEEFFDAINVKNIFESVKKLYVGEKTVLSDNLIISCD